MYRNGLACPDGACGFDGEIHDLQIGIGHQFRSGRKCAEVIRLAGTGTAGFGYHVGDIGGHLEAQVARTRITRGQIERHFARTALAGLQRIAGLGAEIGVVDHDIADQLRAIDVAHEQTILPWGKCRFGAAVHDLPAHGDRATGLESASKGGNAQVLHLQVGAGLGRQPADRHRRRDWRRMHGKRVARRPANVVATFDQ